MRSKISLLTLSLLLAPTLLSAAPGLPTSILPDRQSPLPDTAPRFTKPEPTIQQQAQPQPTLDESAESVKFMLEKINFSGNKVYSTEDLLPLYQHMMHKEITLLDLQALAQAIEKHYLENGYILTRVFIPPQEIDKSGVVKMDIVEGFIDKYLIDGPTKGVTTAIEQYLSEVLKDKPLKLTTLERALLLINDLPGIEAKAVLTPSVETQGASTVVVLINEHLWDGYATWDNRGTKYLGPQEFSVSGSLNNIFNAPGQSTINAKSGSETREFTSYQLAYQAYIAPSGATVNSSFTQNRTHPGNDLAILDIDGISTSVAFVYSYPIIRTRRMNFSMSLDYDYLDSRTDILSQLFTLDRLDSLRGGLNFDVQDAWQGVNIINGQLSKGFQLFSGAPQPELLRSRFGGRKDYTKATLSYTRIQYFNNPTSLMVSMNSQYAFDELLSPEQIGYGGPVYGSAYDPSEIVGDNGYTGKGELRYDSMFRNDLFRSLQYFTSYDWGVLWDRSDIGGTAKQSGTSAAAGVRLSLGPRVNGEIEIAKPLTKPVAAYDNKDARVFFSLSVDLSQR